MGSNVEPLEIIGIKHLSQLITVCPFGAGLKPVCKRHSVGPHVFFPSKEGRKLRGAGRQDKIKGLRWRDFDRVLSIRTALSGSILRYLRELQSKLALNQFMGAIEIIFPHFLVCSHFYTPLAVDLVIFGT